MAFDLNEANLKALNHHIDGILSLFKSGDIDQFKARADLEHLVTAAAANDPELPGFLRAGIDTEVIDGSNAREIE